MSSDSLSIALEDKMPCVAATVTDKAPFSFATLAAFEIVPAVSVSYTHLTLPTKA